MLETTLATRFVPGSNVKGRVVGANWRFLLPSLELERVLCLGAPSPPALAALAQLAGEVIVTAPNRHHLASIPAGTVDLAVVSGRSAARRLEGDPALQAELDRLLKPSGLVYREARQAPRRLGGRLGDQRLFWLAPPTGEAQAAAPFGDAGAIAFLARHAREDSGVRRKPVERLRRHARRHALLSRLRPRTGALDGRPGAGPAAGPPAYLQAVAKVSGLDLSGHRFCLAAPGRYSSKKVLVFLFGAGDARPSAIVKITRDAAFNRRLENEHRALTLLEEKRGGPPEGMPRPLFLGHHAGLALVGETVVEGTPFRLATSGRADCPLLRAALDWLLEFGAATVDRDSASAAEVAAGLEGLFEQLVDVCRIAPGHREFLMRQIAAIGKCEAPFPLVFQHGDPGLWNALVTAGGRVGFLDWESAEPSGMPLWDLLYFMRSYESPRFLADPALVRVLARAVDDHCRRISLARELVEPLFYACWVHRALKEATRLRPERVERSAYANLLRECIDRRDAPALASLFSPPQVR